MRRGLLPPSAEHSRGRLCYKMHRTDPRSDEQLVADLNAGDESTFEVLYYRHRDWVARLAYRFTGNSEDALDVLQETFAYLFRKFPGFVLSARMTTFLYPVVKNLSIAARRKGRREINLDQLPEPPPAMHLAGDDPRDDLGVVLGELPAGQREVVLMRFVDDLSLMEIAQALRIPEGTVKSRLHNALQTLRGDPRVRDYFQ